MLVPYFLYLSFTNLGLVYLYFFLIYNTNFGLLLLVNLSFKNFGSVFFLYIYHSQILARNFYIYHSQILVLYFDIYQSQKKKNLVPYFYYFRNFSQCQPLQSIIVKRFNIFLSFTNVIHKFWSVFIIHRFWSCILIFIIHKSSSRVFYIYYSQMLVPYFLYL